MVLIAGAKRIGHVRAAKPKKKPGKSTGSSATPLQTTIVQRHCKQNLLIIGLAMLVSLGIGAGIGFIGGHRLATKTGTLALVTPKHISEAPNATTAVEPAQTNPLFSIYPSWSQNFATDHATTLNSNDWEVNQGPAVNANHEAEYYTDNPANIRIENGALTLEATKQPEPQNYDYASARIDTAGKVAFLYGRIDITAKLPDSVGSWPAAWFLPATNTYEDLSPASDSTRYLNGGEIDLIEEVGFQPNLEYGIVHTLADQANPNQVGTYNTLSVPNNNTEYNKYSLLWTPTTITFEVNNQPFYSYTKPAGATYVTWPFDQPFYMILNLAIGGSWGGEDGIDSAALPVSMDISSINYYPYVGDTVAATNKTTTHAATKTQPSNSQSARATKTTATPKTTNVLRLFKPPQL